MIAMSFGLLVCFVLSSYLADGLAKVPSYPPDSNYTLNFPERAARHGYPTETHRATTDDGYVITLFRIPRGRKCKGPIRSPPVLIVHGFLGCADSFLDGGPNMSLGYLIADECFDTWFGSVRGTFYSRAHVRLNPDKDRKFWEYSVDEIGMYDIPAFVDYVLNATGEKQLSYMGFSQGGGTFFIMCSERPGYCDKIKLFIGLAPATRHLKTTSVPFRLITQIVNSILGPLLDAGLFEILSKGYPTQKILNLLCQNNLQAELICGPLNTFLDSINPGSKTPNTLRITYQHAPAGVSSQLVARYGQAMTSVDFVKFNYGTEKNMKLYGSPTPPAYKLSAVTAPVLILQGQNDGIVDRRDVLWAAKQMPNVVEYYNVTDQLWGHFDHIRSQYIPIYTFPTIKRYLMKYSTQR